jgi:short-subunit dehydrogenase
MSFGKFISSRTWVVTGAASGLGLELTKIIAKNHGRVWALDIQEPALTHLSEISRREGWDVMTKVVNITDTPAVTRLLDEIKRESRALNVWINNAGIQKVGSFAGQSEAEFDSVMEVNFNSVVRATREVIRIMNDQGDGIVLNIASMAGHLPAPFMSAYVASKHALLGFSRSLRAELSLQKSPLRCAVASPGFVDTSIIAKGQESGFPDWLSWVLASPDACAMDILTSLAKGQDEIVPTLNGKVMRKAYQWAPDLTVMSSRLLLSRSARDFVLNRYQIPRK